MIDDHPHDDVANNDSVIHNGNNKIYYMKKEDSSGDGRTL